jgi:GNAT superfamily N-acetyltransferase
MLEPIVLELTDPDSDLTEQTLALYEAAFPVEERAPLVYLLEDLRWQAQGNRQAEQVRHFLAAVEADHLDGISLYGYYRDYRLAFLAYLATSPQLRGKGLGAWLLKHTVGRLPADAELLGGLPPLGKGLPPVAYHLMFLPVDPDQVIIDQDLKRSAIQTTLQGAYGLDQESEYYRQAIATLKG